MPCNSDYLEPDFLEVEASRVLALLEETRGEKLNLQHFQGFHPLAYNRGITKGQLDEWTQQLCSRLTRPLRPINSYSLELQMWWRNHQIADAKRKLSEEKTRQQREIRKRALAKLTPEERRALGVK